MFRCWLCARNNDDSKWFQAGVETRSAMACYVDLADYTASADKAYADAEPAVWRMDEWLFLHRWRETWQ